MLGAIFKIMWLRLWRDKGALFLAFLLPGAIFAIFAAIFSNASGGQLDIRVSMSVTSPYEITQGFGDALSGTSAFTLTYEPKWTETDISERVRLGQDDVGLVLFGDLSNPKTPSIQIIKDPGREIAATVLMGQIQQELAVWLKTTQPVLFEQKFAKTTQSKTSNGDQSVTYYIGATAILFLLFSAMQGALISLEERKSGISDRILTGPKGTMLMMFGKFLFLTLIGAFQACVILIVAALFFKTPIFDVLPALCLASFGASMLSASIALLTASLASSAAQMNTVSTFLVLLFSAIGGSMVPRFMMPSWLQDVGQFTPNHWVIEAYYGTLARGQTLQDLLGVWGVLYGGSALILVLAIVLSHKLMRA